MQKGIDKLTRTLEGLISLCLLVMLGLIVVLVLLRYVFNRGLVGANEFVTILFVYTTAIGAALGIGRRDHIQIRFLLDRLQPRGKSALDLFGLVLIALLNAVMLWYSTTWIAVTGGYVMPSTQLARACVQVSVPVGCGLAILYCVVRIIGEWRNQWKG